MSETRDGISVDEFMNQRTRQRAIAEAEKAVVEAAKRWYDAHPEAYADWLATAPIALAVQALRELEAQK